MYGEVPGVFLHHKTGKVAIIISHEQSQQNQVCNLGLVAFEGLTFSRNLLYKSYVTQGEYEIFYEENNRSEHSDDYGSFTYIDKYLKTTEYQTSAF